MLEEVIGAVDLEEDTVLQHGHPVAHRESLHLVVGDVDRRRLLQAVVEADELGAHLDSQRRVQVGEGLVHEEDLRLADERSAEGHALALTSREGGRGALQEMADLEQVGDLVDPLLETGLGLLAHAGPEGEVPVDVHVRVERVALEDHRDVALAGRHVGDVAISDVDAAVARALETREHPQRRRLAASRGTNQHDELAGPDVEGEVGDDGVALEELPDVLEADPAHVLAPGIVTAPSITTPPARPVDQTARFDTSCSERPQRTAWDGSAIQVVCQ